MTTFKEISVEDYKKLLDNKQHTFAKTFKNVELLQKFEDRKYRNHINDIINKEKKLENEDKYIEKLTNKLSEKINKNNGELLDIYNNDKESVLKFIKNIYIKYKYASLYKPRDENIEEVSPESIMNSTKNNNEIGRSDRENIYNIYKTNNDLKDVTIDYNEYKNAMDDVEKFRNVDIKKDVKSTSKSSPSTSKKFLIPKLRDNISKTIIENITGQGYNKIKIDQDLLKKILKVRYISVNRKIHNDLLKYDYQISNNMKIAILKNKNINKLSKNEYDVYNALQKYRKNDKLQLSISSYLAGNKSKDLYNKINELLYNNYKNNKIIKKEYQNIINKL